MFQSCYVIRASVYQFGVPLFLIGCRNDTFGVVMSGEGLLGPFRPIGSVIVNMAKNTTSVEKS